MNDVKKEKMKEREETRKKEIVEKASGGQRYLCPS